MPRRSRELTNHNTKKLRKAVARALWVADGKPDNDDLMHQDYIEWTDAVLAELSARGYLLIRPVRRTIIQPPKEQANGNDQL